MPNVDEVVTSQMCTGCGACAWLYPAELEMVDVLEEGKRPSVRVDFRTSSKRLDVSAVCPGVSLSHNYDHNQQGLFHELEAAWGPILGVWEGYAADPELRFSGSSGGAASAIALYCLEQGGMESVLHTASRADLPYFNETVMSRTRTELLSRTGSRYAPASPCEGLGRVEEASGPCVFIGKPCDVAATSKARKLRLDLDEKLGVTIGFFCAGTPSTQGTLEMLKRMGVENTESLIGLRYRGNGWPGKATAVFRADDGGEEIREMTYEETWGEVLSKHQQWRCKLCADHTGEFADISVGDPWYREIDPGDAGRSLILARTQRGREILQAAVAAGYLNVEQVEPRFLPASQPNLLWTRGAVWGRILACRIMWQAYPRYTNIPLFPHWLRELSAIQKIRSIAGTMRRIVARKQRGLSASHGQNAIKEIGGHDW